MLIGYEYNPDEFKSGVCFQLAMKKRYWEHTPRLKFTTLLSSGR